MSAFVIDVHDLGKSFGENNVVDHLSLQVAAGEICGFLGANGSGKTTTIRMLCGLLIPDAGSGTCLGVDLLREPQRIRREVGYMTQRFSFYDDLTVKETLDFVAAVYQLADQRKAVADIMTRMELHSFANRQAGQLSGGWKQRLALAACVLHQPKLLLLDEPTAGVDAAARREFWDLIHDLAAEGLTVLVSTHYMDEALRCKRIVYLSNGHIITQGAPDDIRRSVRLTVIEVKGPGLDEAARHLRHSAAVEAAAVFGATLRVAGTDSTALQQAIAAFDHGGMFVCQEVEPRLEDVFIHLLTAAKADA